jgi:hypothetical protein
MGIITGLQRYPPLSRILKEPLYFKLQSLCFKHFSFYGNEHCNKLHTQILYFHTFMRHYSQLYLIGLCYQTAHCNKAGTLLHIGHAIIRFVHASQVDGKPSEVQSKNLILELLLASSYDICQHNHTKELK